MGMMKILFIVVSFLVPINVLSISLSDSININARLSSLEKIVQQQQIIINELQQQIGLTTSLTNQQHVSQPRLDVSICIPCIPRHIDALKAAVGTIK